MFLILNHLLLVRHSGGGAGFLVGAFIMDLKLMYVSAWAQLMVFIGKHLPSRIKRNVFLTSLPARLKETNKFDNETLSKLNRVMALGNRTDALEISVFLSKAVWRGQSGEEILGTSASVESLAKAPSPGIIANIINKTPAWLHYDEEKMKKDVVRLLQSQDVIFSH